MKKEMNELKDRLKIEGVLYKGFGFSLKFVMLDIDLPLDSKAIYLYFSSFAGSGSSAFPSVGKILNDLNMSKDAYYKYYNLLLKQGYIIAEQTRYVNEKGNTRLGNNVYTLVTNPKKFSEKISSMKKNKTYSKIKFSGLKSFGYGLIPKAVMVDPRLHRKAKALYGYFACFTGSGSSAFPKQKNILYHLNLSRSTYYKYYNQLIDLNYISVEQRHENGRLGVNDYYLNDSPNQLLVEDRKRVKIKEDKEQIQCAKFKDTEEIVDNKLSSQCAKFKDTEILSENQILCTKIQCTRIKDAEKQDALKQDTYNTSSVNTNSININQSINQQGKNKIRLIDIDKKILDKGFKTYEDLIYDVFLPKEHYEYPYCDWIDSAKEALWQMYYYDETSINNILIGSFDIITKLQKLNYNIVYTAIQNAVEATEHNKIKKPVAFLKTVIYNEISEFEARVQAQVSYDMNNHF